MIPPSGPRQHTYSCIRWFWGCEVLLLKDLRTGHCNSQSDWKQGTTSIPCHPLSYWASKFVISSFVFFCRMDYSVFLHKMEEKHFSVSHIIQNSAWAFPFSWAINCLSQKILSAYLFCCSLVAVCKHAGSGRCSIVSTFSTHLCGGRGTSCRWFQIFFSPTSSHWSQWACKQEQRHSQIMIRPLAHVLINKMLFWHCGNMSVVWSSVFNTAWFCSNYSRHYKLSPSFRASDMQILSTVSTCIVHHLAHIFWGWPTNGLVHRLTIWTVSKV